MSNRDPFEGLTPSFSDLAFLKSKLPALKRAGQSRGKKLYVRKGMIDPMPCVICADIYDRYALGAKVKHEYCPSCRRRLENGETCIISKVSGDGVSDGRYAWLEADDNAMANKIIGQVIAVTPDFMDSIELKSRLAALPADQIIMKCPVCRVEAQGVREKDESPACVLVSWPCKAHLVSTDLSPSFFDKNLNPVA